MAGAPAPPRNLVLCLDGTSNQFADKNTNVIKLFSVLEITPGFEPLGHMAYYDSGVGTYLPAGASSTWSHARQEWGKNLDLAVAWNFDDHVKNAYKWLMDYYQPDDKIYLFGFSRGAYAVRVLAGMIERIGLLPAGLHCQIPLAYDVYQDDSPTGAVMAAKYRGIFGISREVNIHFIGVWDTVSSLGGLSAPGKYIDLPFANAVSMVTYFRQALALDERRVKFQPEFRRGAPGVPPNIGHTPRNKEVWFLGVHTSVGGGKDPDVGPSLSNIPFRWMLWEAVQCGLRVGAISILQDYAFMSIPGVWAHVLASLAPQYSALFVQSPATNNPMVLPTTIRANTQAVAQIKLQFDQQDREHVIHLAAQYDTELALNGPQGVIDGSPATADLRSNFTDSLRGPAYWMMDYAPLFLQRRWYAFDGAGSYVEVRDRWRHNGEGRYIQPDQKIHLSVLKKALLQGGAFQLPKAHLFPDAALPASWPALLTVGNANLPLWEVTP